MESYLCEKKNSIVEIMKNPETFNPALTPCLKSEGEGRTVSVFIFAKWENPIIRKSSVDDLL